jgi:hypothetical protein
MKKTNRKQTTRLKRNSKKKKNKTTEKKTKTTETGDELTLRPIFIGGRFGFNFCFGLFVF